MSFDWQTEEDFNWDEEPTAPEPPEPKRRRWPWVLLAMVLLLGTAVSLLYHQLNQRVEVATGDIEADLAASYAVLQQAAVNQDENLFNSLISGRDPEWSQSQRWNLNAGLLFDRPGFNLAWQPELEETAVISQTFSPELNAAELTTQQNYSLNIGNGLTQTVQLERIDVYRLGEDRWLWAPPENAFWGVRRRLEGQLLSVRYPARDEEIVHRLAADLEAKLVQLCATPGITCPRDMRVRLAFSPEPESLSQTAFEEAIFAGGQAIVLPTPTLVGLPQDETGYKAIFRGYASQFLLITLNDLMGWECCENVYLYRAAAERYLHDLGVNSWPLADTSVSLPQDLVLSDVSLFWTDELLTIMDIGFSEAPAPYGLIDFLTVDLALSPSKNYSVFSCISKCII